MRIAASGTLEKLTRMELHLDDLTVTSDPKPSVVRAWGPVRQNSLVVEAEACMWTRRAVAIRFRIAGIEYRCWVWSGAIEDNEAPASRRDLTSEA